DVEIGRTNTDPSRARIEISAEDEAVLATLLSQLQLHGANRVEAEDASLVACEVDGVLPEGFYSTTNLPTQVRLDGHWLDVENPEMDCALVVGEGGRVRTEPMHRVHAGADLARLVREGWIDVLFAGNGFAAHDIESNMLGTSLGVLLGEGRPIEHGHSNHLRAINEVRRRGSISAAVADGYVTGGVMFE